jgi:SAM-dependent methyltransferase
MAIPHILGIVAAMNPQIAHGSILQSIADPFNQFAIFIDLDFKSERLADIFSVHKPTQRAHMALIQTAYNLARLTRYRLKEKIGDWRYGIHSADFFLPTDADNGNPECHPYGAISYKQFRDVLDHIDIRPGVDVFLDYGCGMGRPVVMAAMQPFRRVIGVELSPSLTAVARLNVANARVNLQCSDIELHNIDARQYKVPADVSVVFMCSPFSGSVLRAVLDKVRESVAACPRAVRIVYAYMPGENCLEKIHAQVPYVVDFKPMFAGSSGLALVQCRIDPDQVSTAGTIARAA